MGLKQDLRWENMNSRMRHMVMLIIFFAGVLVGMAYKSVLDFGAEYLAYALGSPL